MTIVLSWSAVTQYSEDKESLMFNQPHDEPFLLTLLALLFFLGCIVLAAFIGLALGG